MYIKGFDKDLRCRGYQFEIGGVYDTGYADNLSCCSKTVFHFCDSLQDVHMYYDVSKDGNRFCEIEVLGELVREDDKYGSNKIKIVREIVGEELQRLKMLTNGNVGLFNTGGWNTGNYNTGGWNTGNYNTGGWNTGDYNTGDCNTGFQNTGNCNTGDCNTGNYNTGGWNTGDCNTGFQNTGNCNTGDCNTGNYNTGGWNTTNFETGFFNTKESPVRIFNKISNLTVKEFRENYDSLFRYFVLTEWIYYTEEEKQKSVIRQCLGGYLKTYTFEEASKNWYGKLNKKEKELLFTIPNFDCDIFEEITGLDVKEEFVALAKGSV